MSGTRIVARREFSHGALRQRAILQGVVDDLASHVERADLLMVTAEVFANAVRHGGDDGLLLVCCRRGPLSLVVYVHAKPLPAEALNAFRAAREGRLPDPLQGRVGGWGFPMMVRLARRTTISSDGRRLRLWFPAPEVTC